MQSTISRGGRFIGKGSQCLDKLVSVVIHNASVTQQLIELCRGVFFRDFVKFCQYIHALHKDAFENEDFLARWYSLKDRLSSLKR